MMMKPAFLFFAGALSLASHAAELPPLDATVSYESRIVTHAGVTETRQFRSLLIRRPGHVWVERVLPEHMAETPEAAHGAAVSHKHFDFDTASQHLQRDAKGELRAEYIDRVERQVVFVPRTEYSVPGFDGSWDNAASLVAEKTVLAMPLSYRKPPVADAEWREESRNGWFNRVLWSRSSKVALIIESGRNDGTVWRKTVVEPRPLTPDGVLPWKRLSGYAQKEYDDFMD